MLFGLRRETLGLCLLISSLSLAACGSRAEHVRAFPVPAPDTLTLEALRKMRDDNIGCLPVLGDNGELVGLLTARDLLKVAATLMEK